MESKERISQLVLEDGSLFEGHGFGFPSTIAGEVVFNTGMVGYPETFTDPSYKGQILVLTYPLIGNYGVAGNSGHSSLQGTFESSHMQIAGLIVSEVSSNHNHWNATMSLIEWLHQERIPALSGIDTRALTKHLREQGSMGGKIVTGGEDIEFYDPNQDNLVSRVSVPEPIVYPGGKKRIVVVDCGCKNSIIRSLLSRDVTVIRVPWNYDFLREDFDGVLISNGPGDPKMCGETIANVRRAMEREYPILGVCLGHQILALAAGATRTK